MEATLWQRFDEIITRTVRPMAERCDEESLFCGESVRALADAGFTGLPYPPKLGGRGSSYESYVRYVERLSEVCPSVGIIYATHVGLACHPLHAFGSPMQKESFLRPMLRGDELGAFALTEPEAGSDVGVIATTAELDSGFYIINGHKIFITNAGRADIYIPFVRTGGQDTEGLSAFVVCSGDAGLLISAPQRKMGIRGAQTCELFLRNLCIPADCLIGRPGDGLHTAMEMLDGGRLGIAAQAVGIADAAFDEACVQPKECRQFGRTLEHLQGLRWKAADMWAKAEAARQLTLYAARLHDGGKRFRVEASTAKLVASEAAMWYVSEAVQICGGSSYLQGSATECLYRGAKITQIYEGTSEVQRMVIASGALG